MHIFQSKMVTSSKVGKWRMLGETFVLQRPSDDWKWCFLQYLFMNRERINSWMNSVATPWQIQLMNLDSQTGLLNCTSLFVGNTYIWMFSGYGYYLLLATRTAPEPLSNTSTTSRSVERVAEAGSGFRSFMYISPCSSYELKIIKMSLNNAHQIVSKYQIN